MTQAAFRSVGRSLVGLAAALASACAADVPVAPVDATTARAGAAVASANDGERYADLGACEKVTFIQRLNTVGGKAPSTPGSFVGQEARVAYTADYLFYKAP